MLLNDFVMTCRQGTTYSYDQHSSTGSENYRNMLQCRPIGPQRTLNSNSQHKLTLVRPSPLAMISEKQRRMMSLISLKSGSNMILGSSTFSLMIITWAITYCSSSKSSPKSFPFWNTPRDFVHSYNQAMNLPCFNSFHPYQKVDIFLS